MLKKGNRVEWEEKGNIEYGVVFKGGSNRINVILDGGKKILKGHISIFKLSNKPLETDSPNIMDKWGVVSFKDFESRNGYGYNAKITLNGKVVIHAHDEGRGGCVSFYASKKEYRELEEQLHEDCKKWVKLFSEKYHNEIASSWLLWFVDNKPYSVTAKKYWKEWDKQMEEWDKKIK